MSIPASYDHIAIRDAQGPHPERQDRQRGAFNSDNMSEPEGITVLPAESKHSNRHIRFIYSALADVVRTRLPVSGWDNNDYEYLAVLARSLEDSSLPLSEIVWDKASGWSREKVAVAKAINAHFYNEWKVAEASNDEDLYSDVANDTCYLVNILGLDDPENPFAVYGVARH